MSKKNQNKNIEAPTRDQLKAKLQEVDAVVNETTNAAQSTLKIVAGIAIAGVVLIAFASGRRRALRPKTVVSFTKLK